MSKKKQIRVHLAKVSFSPEVLQDMFLKEKDFWTAIKENIIPNSPIERYNRIWMFGKSQITEEYIAGKLGFTTSQIRKGATYDLSKLDFVEKTVVEDTAFYSYYVLHRTGYMLFETHPPTIKIQSFLGAFNMLINQKAAPYSFRVHPVMEKRTFFEWAGNLKQLIKAQIYVERPNPGYSPRTKAIEDFLESTNANQALIETETYESGSLKIEGSPLLVASIEHASRGYGRIRGKGITKQEETSEYDSVKHAKSYRIIRKEEQSEKDYVIILLGKLRMVIDKELEDNDAKK